MNNMDYLHNAEWSQKELAILITMFNEGNDFTAFAKKLPNRTRGAIRNKLIKLRLILR